MNNRSRIRTIIRAHRGLRACLVLLAGAVSAMALAGPPSAADSIQAQRKAFITAYASARKGNTIWKTQAAKLKSYPLYPYLPAAALEHDLRTATPAQVQAYLDRWPNLIPAADLRRHFLHELARRKDWKAFQSMYRPGLGSTLTCDALQAHLAQGGKLHFKRDLAALWKHASLPNACDPVQAWAQKHGLLTRARLWQRIDTAADAGRGGTVAALAQWLSGDDAIQAHRLALAIREPSRAATDALKWPDNPRNRHAATLAMRALARHNTTQADAVWPKLRTHLTFSTTQRNHILHDLALYRATDFTDNAIARLRALPKAAQTDSTRAWRMRVALARRDWKAALDAWAAMDARQKSDNEWRYFHARTLDALGQHAAARKAFASLSSVTTYYGFLAADQVHRPYTICPAKLADDAAGKQALLKKPGLRRAFELFAVDMQYAARREWNRALHGASGDSRRLAAMMAWQHGWYDRAIFTYSSGDALHLYTQRFPLARQDRVSAQAKDAGIDPAWAYALIRAESAWKSDAHSGAGAYGLMQLMPYTAKRVARKLGKSYAGVQQLYDPKFNIALGTHYLGQMAARYGGAPWLASAAYNAGPRRVDQWLSARGDLPPDLFVATIPFHETRGYVASVMAFSVLYDWRLHQRTVPLSSRMPRFGKPYHPPSAKSPRQAVICPSADQPAHAGSVARAAKAAAKH